jgi:hypothetical protein
MADKIEYFYVYLEIESNFIKSKYTITVFGVLPRKLKAFDNYVEA